MRIYTPSISKPSNCLSSINLCQPLNQRAYLIILSLCIVTLDRLPKNCSRRRKEAEPVSGRIADPPCYLGGYDITWTAMFAALAARL